MTIVDSVILSGLLVTSEHHLKQKKVKAEEEEEKRKQSFECIIKPHRCDPTVNGIIMIVYEPDDFRCLVFPSMENRQCYKYNPKVWLNDRNPFHCVGITTVEPNRIESVIVLVKQPVSRSG